MFVNSRFCNCVNRDNCRCGGVDNCRPIVSSNCCVSGPRGPQGERGIDGVNGQTPFIGRNGNWFVGGCDTGVPARGLTGETGPQGPSGQLSTAYSTQTGEGGTSIAANGTVPFDIVLASYNIAPISNGVQIVECGIYVVSYNLNIDSNQSGRFVIQVNGITVLQSMIQFASSGDTYSSTTLLPLNVGDVVTVVNSSSISIGLGANTPDCLGLFNIYKIA
ncbi:MAG: hypothetical protein FWF56_05760 [Firmicutes bacterium]|nr:hypothetical protein [Bacillota bacterium]MCL1953583.1 hypothetical protein [Bacillota bacterium]